MFQRSLIIFAAIGGLLACQSEESDQPIVVVEPPIVVEAIEDTETQELHDTAETLPVRSYTDFLETVQTSPKTSSALFGYLDKDMPEFWDETTWDFYGMSRIPGEGEIACGYFVTTLLKDLGFQIDRIRLAQEPSGVMIEEFTVNIKKSNSLHQTLEAIRHGPDNAIYIIGLDFHTGFISHSAEGTFFIHSDYNGRRGVVREYAASSLALSQSGFFMIGNLTDSQAFLARWD